MVKETARLKRPEEMTPEELEAFNKKPEWARAEYTAKLTLQDAQDALAKAKENKVKQAGEAKTTRERTAGIRKVLAAVRAGEIGIEKVREALGTLAITSTGAVAINPQPPTEIRHKVEFTPEQIEAAFNEIKEGLKKPQAAATAPKITAPAFTLSHGFSMVAKEAILPPTDGGRPDATLNILINRFGHVAPFLLGEADPATGLHPIIDGRRRYHLLKAGEIVPAVFISGFPDDYTREAAEVGINRGRSLNALRAAEVIERSRQRGKTDAEIRRDMGFKTGEVDKYAAVLNIPQAIREGLNTGRVTANVALLVGRQPKHIQEALAQDFTARLEKEAKDGVNPQAPVRLTEANVEEARQAAAKSAVNRDKETLTGLTQGVANEATGTPVNP